MKMEKVVSEAIDIIIPVYNTPSELLERCILSVLCQTYKKIKILIIDDGSTNKETLAILNKYKNHRNIHLYTQENAGVSVARNAGLEHSKGDYVFFLDSDDFIKKDYLEHLLSVAKKQKVKLVFSGKVNSLTKKNDAPFKEHKINIVKDSNVMVFKAHAFTCSAVLIDGKIARGEKFTTTITTMGEDTEYIIKCMIHSDSYFDGEGGHFYVQNPQSITHDVSLKSIERYLEESILQRNIFKKYLEVSDESIDIYSYLKLAYAHRKLSLNFDKSIASTVAKRCIEKNNLPKIKIKSVVKHRLLTKGEKIRILLVSRGFLGVTYHLNLLLTKIKNTK